MKPITIYTTIDKLDEMSEDAQQLVGLAAVLGCADMNRVSEEELENAMWLLRKLARKVCTDVCAMGTSDTRQNVRAI